MGGGEGGGGGRATTQYISRIPSLRQIPHLMGMFSVYKTHLEHQIIIIEKGIKEV